MWMFGSRTTVKKVRNSLTWFSQNQPLPEALDFLDGATCAPRANKTVPVAFSEARFQVKKSACFWRHGRCQE